MKEQSQQSPGSMLLPSMGDEHRRMRGIKSEDALLKASWLIKEKQLSFRNTIPPARVCSANDFNKDGPDAGCGLGYINEGSFSGEGGHDNASSEEHEAYLSHSTMCKTNSTNESEWLSSALGASNSVFLEPSVPGSNEPSYCPSREYSPKLEVDEALDAFPEYFSLLSPSCHCSSEKTEASSSETFADSYGHAEPEGCPASTVSSSAYQETKGQKDAASADTGTACPRRMQAYVEQSLYNTQKSEKAFSYRVKRIRRSHSQDEFGPNKHGKNRLFYCDSAPWKVRLNTHHPKDTERNGCSRLHYDKLPHYEKMSNSCTSLLSTNQGYESTKEETNQLKSNLYSSCYSAAAKPQRVFVLPRSSSFSGSLASKETVLNRAYAGISYYYEQQGPSDSLLATKLATVPILKEDGAADFCSREATALADAFYNETRKLKGSNSSSATDLSAHLEASKKETDTPNLSMKASCSLKLRRGSHTVAQCFAASSAAADPVSDDRKRARRKYRGKVLQRHHNAQKCRIIVLNNCNYLEGIMLESMVEFVSKSEGSAAKYYTITALIDMSYGSQIYRCSEKSSGKCFAIKAIPKQDANALYSNYRQTCQLFQLLLKHTHPNIVKLHRFLEDEETFYVVMDWCDGPTIFDYFMSRLPGSISEKHVKEIVLQLLLALDLLHSYSFVHGDVKFENLMFKENFSSAEYQKKVIHGYDARDYSVWSNIVRPETKLELPPVCLIDVDGAKSVNQLLLNKPVNETLGEDSSWKAKYVPQFRYESSIVGSAPYMSPEAYDGFLCTASDMWSCGILLYALTDGNFPFDLHDSTPFDVRRDIIVHQEPHFDPLVWADRGAAANLCLRLLDPNPMTRVQSAREALIHQWFSNNGPHSE